MRYNHNLCSCRHEGGRSSSKTATTAYPTTRQTLSFRPCMRSFRPSRLNEQLQSQDVLRRHPTIMKRITKRLLIIGGGVVGTLVCLLALGIGLYMYVTQPLENAAQLGDGTVTTVVRAAKAAREAMDVDELGPDVLPVLPPDEDFGIDIDTSSLEAPDKD